MKRLIVICIIATICVGCSDSSSSIDKAISQVENAMDQLEKNKDNLSEEDWNSIEKQVEEPMKVITDVLENGKCGVKGKMKVISVMAKWTTVVTDVGFRETERAKTGKR
jgi:hypothetical protein